MIDLVELREAAENDGESSTTVYIGGPGWATVLALVEAVEAAYAFNFEGHSPGDIKPYRRLQAAMVALGLSIDPSGPGGADGD